MFNAHIVAMTEAKIDVLYNERELAFHIGNATNYNIYDQLVRDQFKKLHALECES